MCVTHIYMKSCFFVRVFVRSVTWLIHVCDMTHSCVWHDSFMCVTWLIHVCALTHSYLCRDSADVFGTDDMTKSFLWHNSFICVTWLVHTYAGTQPMYSGLVLSVFGLLIMFRERFVRAMTHLHVWHDSSICQCLCCSSCFASGSCVPWVIYMCDLTHSYVSVRAPHHISRAVRACHDSFLFVSWLIHICLFSDCSSSFARGVHVWWLIPFCDMTHPYATSLGPISCLIFTEIILQTNPVMYSWLICGRFVERDLKDNGSSLLQHTATHCNTLQRTATHWTHLNALEHTAIHWNTLQRIATHCNSLQQTATHCNTLDTLQHTATHCSTLQHTKLRYPTGLGSPVMLSLSSTNDLRMCEGVRVCVCVCVRVCGRACIA